MAIILDGKKLASDIMKNLQKRVDYIRTNLDCEVCLDVVQVGDDPASNIYIRNKEKACHELGIKNHLYKLDEKISDTKFMIKLNEISSRNNDGILVQLPLPPQINKISVHIPFQKDVDGLTYMNSGLFYAGGNNYFTPCTPKGIIRLLKAYGVPLAGKHAVVVGRSQIVGKPISFLLLNENCTVTMCHSYTENLSEISRQADILIVAVGKSKMITGEMIKPGAAIVDVGINRVNGKVVGDVDFESVEPVAGWITPVPGGVGPMTICMLMENTIESAERRYSIQTNDYN